MVKQRRSEQGWLRCRAVVLITAWPGANCLARDIGLRFPFLRPVFFRLSSPFFFIFFNFLPIALLYFHFVLLGRNWFHPAVQWGLLSSVHLVGKEALGKSVCDLRKARDPYMSGSFIHNTWLTTIIAVSGVQGGSLSGSGHNEVRMTALCQRLLDTALGNSLNNSLTHLVGLGGKWSYFIEDVLGHISWWLWSASVWYGKRQ